MAIKRWNANTSTWELVGTPGTATPSAIGAATLASTGNTFLGVQTITSASEWPLISRFTNPTSSHRNHLLLQRSNNNAAVTSGFSLGGISMSGHDGANYGLGWNGGAEITAFAAETWTPSARGTHLAFFNTANGTNSIAERMRIDSSGNVGIGTGAPANFGGTNLQVNHATGYASLLINSGSRTMQILASDINGVTSMGARSNHSLVLTTNDTERMRILNTGSVLVNTTSLLNNELFGIRNTGNVQTLWLEQTDSNFSTVAQAIRTTRTNNSAYTYFITYSNNGGDTEHYLRGDGQAYADGSWNGGGADYAEYFEWADGNPNNENRLGYAVSLINDKIKIAEEGETPIGVISGNPSVVGDHASNKWSGKYLKNDFGVYLRDENGDRILNPEFDPEAEYISREDRPEWSIVGLMGKLRLRKGQVTGAGWIKMKDISSEVEEWLVK